MNKYICALALIVSFVVPQIGIASIDVCNIEPYTVVTINGMLNSITDAEKNRKALESFLPTTFNSRELTVRKAYNPSHLAGVGDGIKVLIQKTYDQMKRVTGLDYDSREMLTSLSDEVKEGRILFVPHSQGNFYANSMYGWIVKQEGGLSADSMNMYNVASPTQLSAKKSKYILSKTDKIIAGLVGSVGAIAPPNVDFDVPQNSNGHGFVDTYLAYGGERMIDDIKSQLEILKVDNSKDQTKPCIPMPEQTASQDLLSIFYKVADPISNVIKDTASLAISASKFGLSSIASSIGFGFNKNKNEVKIENKYVDTLEKSPSIIEEIIPLAPSSQPATNSNEDNSLKSETKVIENKKGVEGDELSYYLKKIEELRKQIEKQKTNNTKYYGSGFINNMPQPISPIIISNTTSTEIETKIEENSTSSTSTISIPQNIEASTTTPIEDVILGTDIIEVGTVRNVSVPSSKILPTDGNIIISEYYIGKEGEATWVEVFNTSRNKWVDTSSVVFMENNKRFQFPVTAIAPFSSVILRSDGRAIHSLTDNNIPVSYSLDNYIRNEGGFYLIYQNGMGGEGVVDFTYYGGLYCRNKYSFSRSCERMITSVFGDREDFWVRARVVNSDMDPKKYNSVGVNNMAWDFDTYEGRKIKGIYPNEKISRNKYGYVSGEINIYYGDEIILDDKNSFWLIKSDTALFGDENETKIEVRGKLRSSRTSSIDNIDGNNSYITIYNGGLFMRDSYTTVNVPIKIVGGAARLNIMTNKVKLESGKLFITGYGESGYNPTSKLCSDYRNGLTNLNWIGGELYLAGESCGDRNDTNEIPDQNKFDYFGIIDRRDPKNCPAYHWNENMELECGAFVEPPHLDDDSSITQSTSTSPIENSDNGGSNSSSTSTSTPSDNFQNNSTSTQSGLNDNSASSTENNLPSDNQTEGDGSSGIATTTDPFPLTPTSTSTDSGLNNGGEVSGASTSTLLDLGLTADGCFNGSLSDVKNEAQRNAVCGNGWNKRPVATLQEAGKVLRAPKQSRLQITEYYIGNNEGEASWFKISNMTQGAQLSMYNTDFIINDERRVFPVMGIPNKQYIILRNKGTLVVPIPDSSFDFGKTTTKYIEAEVLPDIITKDGKISLIFAWDIFSEQENIDEVTYSRNACEGTITEYGSCKLNKPPLFWNDISDGFIE